MCLDDAGDRCLVADDCVYVYDVSDCQPGIRWPLLYTLTQSLHTRPMQQLLLMPTTMTTTSSTCAEPAAVVVARDTALADPRDSDTVFCWTLPAGAASSARSVAACVEAAVYRVARSPAGQRCVGDDGGDMRVTAMCAWSGDALLLATTRAGVLLTLRIPPPSKELIRPVLTLYGWAAAPRTNTSTRTSHRVRYMQCIMTTNKAGDEGEEEVGEGGKRGFGMWGWWMRCRDCVCGVWRCSVMR